MSSSRVLEKRGEFWKNEGTRLTQLFANLGQSPSTSPKLKIAVRTVAAPRSKKQKNRRTL